MQKIFFALALIGLAASPALAQQSDLDATLARLAAAQGDDYVSARDAAVKSLESADLEAKLAAATWTDATFPSLSMATIVLAHQKDPATVERVNHLPGLDAAHYMQRRYGAPDVTRELRNFGDKASAALLEIHLKTFERYPFSKDEAARAKERLALRIGIVVQLAAVKHPSALFVAKQIANDPAQPEGARNQAVGALGTIDTADSFRALVAIHDAAGTPASLKQATLRGAAWASSTDAFNLIMKDLDSDDAALRRQAGVALGTFASAWGWQARGEAAVTRGEDFRRQAAAKLVEALERDRLPSDVIVDQIGVVAHASAKPLLEADVANEKLTAAQRETAKLALDRLKTNLDRNAKR